MDYTPYIIRQRENKDKLLVKRYARAWEVAKRASQILKEKYSAQEVIIFGSLVHKELFHSRSDIDISVRGVEPQKFFQAVYDVAGIDEEIDVELVDIEECKDYISTAINKEGIKL